MKKEVESIREVRDYVENLKIGKSKIINISPVNKGLANSIRDGINVVLKEHEQIIVLEDDISVSSGFLAYMNQALELYNDKQKVMHISGYMFPIETDKTTFFYNYTSCWGWATWRTAWSKLEWDVLKLKKDLLKSKKMEHFSLNGLNDNISQLDRNISGTLRSWAVRWQASVEINDGFCLHPGKSLVNNIGFDGSGTNCGNGDTYFHPTLSENIALSEIPMKEDQEIVKQMKSFYNKRTSQSNRTKLRSRVSKALDISPRKILNRIRQTNNLSQEFKALRSMPRYTPFQVTADSLVLNGIDSASFLSMWKEIFENETYKFTPVNDQPIIIDAGANIGLSAIYFSLKYPNAVIYAYEADPDIYRVLKSNLDSNNFQNLKSYNNAIWSETKKLKFIKEGADAGRLHTLEGGNDFIEVQALSFKEILSTIKGEIDMLKMDIEGAEVDVLNSYPEGLLRINNLFVEYHSFEESPQQLDVLLKLLSDAGLRYQIYNTHSNNLDSPLLNKRKYGDMDLQVNIFASKII